MTAKVAEAQVPIGCPLGPRVWAVSPHWTIVLSAPAPSMVMNDLNGGMLTFSLDRHKKKKEVLMIQFPENTIQSLVSRRNKTTVHQLE